MESSKTNVSRSSHFLSVFISIFMLFLKFYIEFRCIINTYDIGSLKKKKAMKLPNEVPNKDVAFMRFTEDSRGLAILSKEPDAFLTIFYFDKSETIIVGRVSNGNQTGLTADVIACNLSDTGLVAVAGMTNEILHSVPLIIPMVCFREIYIQIIVTPR